MTENERGDEIETALQLLMEASALTEHEFTYRTLVGNAAKLLPNTDERDVGVLLLSLALLYARIQVAELPATWRGGKPWLDQDVDVKKLVEQQIVWALYAVHRDRNETNPPERRLTVVQE